MEKRKKVATRQVMVASYGDILIDKAEPRRVTVVMPGRLDMLIRNAQAQQIKLTNDTCSYSKMLSLIVAKGLGVNK